MNKEYIQCDDIYAFIWKHIYVRKKEKFKIS